MNTTDTVDTDRLGDLFSRLRAEKRKALGLFVTDGFPDPASTLPILRTLDGAGADFIELGMPFSDPLAEGLPIQRSSARALGHGTRMDHAFHTARAFRAASTTPLLLMGYYNPVLRYGVGNFCRDAASSGVDGLILPDVPPEESSLLAREARAAGLRLVFLVAPNTSDARMQQISRQATGFVYAVSVSGLTGQKGALGGEVERYLARARAALPGQPLLVGFGIRTGRDAARLSRHTDGVIVGSALIEKIEALWDDGALDDAARHAALADFVRQLHPDTPTP